MDNKSEDTIVRQIEKNLSNNMNESLFLTGRIYENSKAPVRTSVSNTNEGRKEIDATNDTYPLVYNDYINNVSATISRAEYIRQAREACLRQLSNTQVYSRAYDVNYMEPESIETEQTNSKKAKAWKLFQEEPHLATATNTENSPQEIAAFRSLVIRMVCAILLFVTIFIIDKFEIKIGLLTNQMIQQYVTGNDSLQQLQEIILTWLK